MEKQYDVFENNYLVFTGNEKEANIVFDRLNTFLEHTHNDATMSEHNNNITETPWYKCYDEFKDSHYIQTCFNDVVGLSDSNNKYVVKTEYQLETIVNSSPVDADLSFLDISKIKEFPTIKQKMILNWDTSHITSFAYAFREDNIQPYQYDLNWLFIKNGANISGIFSGTKFCKKLPRMETKISFNEFVKRTKLIVTPELLKNNDMDVKEWCNNKHKQKLMKTNNLYEPMLEYWVTTDYFDSVEEKLNVIQETNVQVFDI